MSRNKSKDFGDESDDHISRRPSLTPDAKENQMIALAMVMAEKQLRDGTASSQVITHFLKLGSSKERLEQEILEKQSQLLEAKTESLKSTKVIESLYSEAMKAMKIYKGEDDNETSPDQY